MASKSKRPFPNVMKISEKCRARTCPCKGCPQVETCRKGCIYCDETGKARKMGFCSILRRDGQLLYQERRKQKNLGK